MRKIKNMTAIKAFLQSNKFKRLSLIIILPLALLSLSACSISTNSSSERGTDSSVFVSTDGGTTWREAASLASSGNPQNIRQVNVNMMAFDPQDHLAVYLASREHGLYYTYNVSQDGWSKVKSLPSGLINEVEVDPENKCLIYAAIANRLYASRDCARTFEQLYFDNNPEVAIKTVEVDYYNPQNIYIGTSRGEVIKSIDGGGSWRTIHRLDNGVKRITLSPIDSRLVFIASDRNRIYSFTTSSSVESEDPISRERSFEVENFNDLNAVLKDYDLGKTFRDFDISKNAHMFIATNQTILRSTDDGITWEQLSLIPPENEAIINAMAVDPQNPDNIFYVTNTTFYRSTDGGITWSTKKLPTSRAGSELLVDPTDARILYLGTVKLK